MQFISHLTSAKKALGNISIFTTIFLQTDRCDRL